MIATVKHLAANNQENNRWDVDARVSERALREIYLPAFEAAVDAGVLSVMAAYNSVNGQFATENAHLQVDILHKEWGFRGFTVSDWGATHGAASAAVGGLDVEMPYGPLPHYPMHFGNELAAAVTGGQVTAERLDDMVRRVLTAMIAVDLMDGRKGSADVPANTPAHRALARQAAAAGTVLLRNDNEVLPLAGGVRSIAVIGVAADSAAVFTGGGSALVRAGTLTSPLVGIRSRAGDEIEVRFSPEPPAPAPCPRSRPSR